MTQDTDRFEEAFRKYLQKGNAIMAITSLRVCEDLGHPSANLLRTELLRYFGEHTTGVNIQMFYLPATPDAPASIHASRASAVAYRVKTAPLVGLGDLVPDLQEFSVHLPFAALEEMIGK